MEQRRGGRSTQVSPRPPSNGRQAPVKVRPIAPSPTRLAGYRTIERRRSLPLVLKAGLTLAIVALAGGVLYVAGGSVGPAVGSVVDSLGGIVDTVGSVVASPAPTEAPPVADAPSIEEPEEPYTNDEQIDVTVNVPLDVVGLEDHLVRLWVTVGDAQPTVVAEVPVGPTAVLLVPDVRLEDGRNDFQASIVGPGGESELSAIASWILDTSKPKLTIIEPKNNLATTRDAITIKGKTQAASSVRVRNEANDAIATVDADSDGLFKARIALAAGINAIQITTTDPAGNTNEASLRVRKGSGELVIVLTGSAYRFNAAKLPKSASFTVTVTGPDGRRVADATALFTVSVPGLEAIVSSEIATGRDGRATFTTNIPKGALPGSGLATVLVSTPKSGQGTDRQVLTVR
jgi:hypothetical protein